MNLAIDRLVSAPLFTLKTNLVWASLFLLVHNLGVAEAVASRLKLSIAGDPRFALLILSAYGLRIIVVKYNVR